MNNVLGFVTACLLAVTGGVVDGGHCYRVNFRLLVGNGGMKSEVQATIAIVTLRFRLCFWKLLVWNLRTKHANVGYQGTPKSLIILILIPSSY